jgi:predicted amidohydrolase YtcJ
VRNLLDAGVRTAIGTDNVPISMFGPMGYLVGRTDRAGKPVNPSQAITAEEALRCATIEGAWLSFDETRKGRLTPGMLADMVVLDQDPLSLSAPDISSLEARLTLCGGRVVYERAASVS